MLRRIVFSVFLSLSMLWLGGFVWFWHHVQGIFPLPPHLKTDAVVVLTGGSHRIETGVALIQNEASQVLFISGVDKSVSLDRLLKSTGLNIPAHLEQKIHLGYQAQNTQGNAQETATWLHQQGYTSCRLVTAHYHMPRSLLEFHLAAPDLKIFAHPIVPELFALREWQDRLEKVIILWQEYNKTLALLFRSQGKAIKWLWHLENERISGKNSF